MQSIIDFFKKRYEELTYLSIDNIENLVEKAHYDGVFGLLMLIGNNKQYVRLLNQTFFSERQRKNTTILEIIVKKCPLFCVKKVIQILSPLSGEKQTKLISLAIERESIEMLRFFKETGFDFCRDHTRQEGIVHMLPVHQAFINAGFYKTIRYDAVDYLLEIGVDINGVDRWGRNTNNIIGLTAEPDLFSYAIDKGLDINKITEGLKDYLIMSLNKICMCQQINTNGKYLKEYCDNVIENLNYLKKRKIHIVFDQKELMIRVMTIEDNRIVDWIMSQYWHMLDKNIIFAAALETKNTKFIKKMYSYIHENSPYYDNQIYMISSIIWSPIYEEKNAEAIKSVMSLFDFKVQQQQDKNGDTVFHLLQKTRSFHKNYENTFILFVEYGYDIDKKNNQGVKAINLCQSNDFIAKELFSQEYAKKEQALLKKTIQCSENKSEKKRL